MDEGTRGQLKGKKIIVFMPAYNEEKNIGKVIENIPDFVNKTIVVDDCSSDNTGKIAKEKGAIVVLIHSDGQHDPADIINVVKPILKGEAGYILGGRVDNMFKNMPMLRYIGNKVLS